MRVALLGAGRIAEVHARGIRSAGAELAGVYDLRREAAEAAAGRFGGEVYADVEAALVDPRVEAVAIATPTDTHVDYLVRAVAAGKHVFCEKPIDLSVARALECRDRIGDAADRVQIGFNRRFDRTFARLRERLGEGAIGRIENLTIISRDPAPAPISYLASSGGILKDMTIHDFDMARLILGEEPVEVFATGSVLVDPAIGEAGDHDSISVVMRTASGVQCQILNTRRCAFGYDQRIEVFGEKGSLRAENPLVDELRVNLADGTDMRSRLSDFFLDRYIDAFAAQWVSFFANLWAGRPPAVTFRDGLRALELAEAGNRSIAERRVIEVPAH
ncbi:inositol 2-dehydrogenase [Aureimonas flava]|uniref:Inositol 2-dehydrogenase n=1 Tax=Aureimonas flava TaxID=2320271 RepID=A0A3A1WN31_9HYPH|nr:inositol 2-dehydrogenase [Aureimonas flava]RIY01994.1 inositol 2-dehydrogenase [Aureimonas flava]